MIKTVEVTQQDIDTGIPSESCDCPVAKAIARLCKSDVSISVCSDLIIFAYYNEKTKDAKEAQIDLAIDPKHEIVSKFICEFDINYMSGPPKLPEDIAQPFSFELDIQEWALK